jgi:hypothetical protein
MTGIITAPKVPGKHSIQHNPPSILIPGGAVLVIARVVLPYRAGVIFKGSLATITSLCHSPAGALGQAMNTQLQGSCSEADAWMNALTIALVIGLGMAAAGVFLAWQRHQHRETLAAIGA